MQCVTLKKVSVWKGSQKLTLRSTESINKSHSQKVLALVCQPSKGLEYLSSDHPQQHMLSTSSSGHWSPKKRQKKATFPHPPVDTGLIKQQKKNLSTSSSGHNSKKPTEKTTYPAEKSTCPLTRHPEPTDERSRG